MGKNKTIVLGAVLVATLLAGCGDQNAALEQHAEAEAASSPETTEVPAFHFESGTLELGDFDPQTLGDDLFDPCTEISEEEFAAAGITGVEAYGSGEYAANGAIGCTLEAEMSGTSRMIIMNPANLQILQSDVHRDVVIRNGSVVDGLYTHTVPSSGGRVCFAQVDTVRGGLTAEYSISSNLHRALDPCEKAVETLELLYLKPSN